jgi:hypothetical protein
MYYGDLAHTSTTTRLDLACKKTVYRRKPLAALEWVN